MKPMQRRVTKTILGAWALGLAACGESAGATDGGADAAASGDGAIVVSGGTVNHSMNRLAEERTGTSVALSELQVAVLGLDALLADPAAPALASAPLVTSGCGAMTRCTWTLRDVPLAGASGGFVARLTDTRASGPLWVTTLTGFSSAAEVTAAASSGTVASGQAFAVSRQAIDAVVSPLAALSGDALMARGFVFGLVYAGVSANGSGTPVVGATVAANGGGMTIVYPNNTFSATASATANQGVFLAIPTAAGAVTSTTFTITPPAGQALSWDATAPAAVVPNAVYFALRFAR